MLTPTQKTFLDSLKIVPKKKIPFGKSKDQKQSDELRTAFKNYRKAESAAIKEIKNLSKLPNKKKETKDLEGEVKVVQTDVQDAPNQDAATATETLTAYAGTIYFKDANFPYASTVALLTLILLIITANLFIKLFRVRF